MPTPGDKPVLLADKDFGFSFQQMKNIAMILLKLLKSI
jgi:hypothetical protein